MVKKVALHTMGCRLNFSETGSIAQGFAERGFEVVEFGEPADVVFLNTCTVTDQADSSCRNLIRKAHRSSPEGMIVVAGCYAQMEPEAISKMQGVDLVLGTSEKYKVFDYLDEYQEQMVSVDKTNDFWGASTGHFDGHTRAFLKIQDGCNYICSFCIIPFARGRSRAISIAKAKEEAQNLIGKGFKEIVLTGVNIGEYESNSGEKLSDLIQELLNLPGLERLRLSSVEPNTFNEELLQVMSSSPKFMDHFHVPLQSGSDGILTSMRRKYSVSDYKKIIMMIKKYFPHAAIGADVIVGYPGETEEYFLETENLLKELPITHFHIFPYSKRKKTTAASLPDQIPHHVKKERVRRLNLLGEEKLKAFSLALLGSTQEILFEKLQRDEEGRGYCEGYTSHFVKVRVLTEEDFKNQVKKVDLEAYVNDKVVGVVKTEEAESFQEKFKEEKAG